MIRDRELGGYQASKDMQPFTAENESEMSPEELRAAADVFSAVTTNVLEGRYGKDSVPSRAAALVRINKDDNAYLSVLVDKYTTGPDGKSAPEFAATMLMQEIDPKGDGHRMVEYGLPPSGKRVVRRDFGDIDERRSDLKNSGVSAYEFHDRLFTSNNQQPVGPEEMAKLMEVMSEPEYVRQNA